MVIKSAMKFLLELENEKIEKIDSIIKQFDDKYKTFKNVEFLYEEKEEELKEVIVDENKEIFMPQEIKSFVNENKTTLESL